MPSDQIEPLFYSRRETRARLSSPGGWGVIGSSTEHVRYALAVTDGRRRRARCRQGDDCPNRVTHYGVANGVALMAGCYFHAMRWVRDAE